MEHYELNLKDLDPCLSDLKEVKPIGQGGFGSVYQAKYIGHKVAVKLIHDDMIGDAKKTEEECKVMMQVHHPNVVRLYGFNLEPKTSCLVMELAELGSLYSILKETDKYPNLPWKRKLQIAVNIATGLMCLRDRRKPIIHLDLKSLNVLIRSDWSAFISDFGLARITDNTKCIDAEGVGSFPWMAPEVIRRAPLSQAVDIFSFGMVLYELLTRKIPFGKEKMQAHQIAQAISAGKRPMISNERCPEGYLQLMRDCWEQDPSKRPSASDIVKRLNSLPEFDDSENSLQLSISFEFLERSSLRTKELPLCGLKADLLSTLRSLKTFSDSAVMTIIEFYLPDRLQPDSIQEQAAKGDPFEQARLGYCYEYGAGGMKKDYTEALKWYELSKNQGHGDGFAGVGGLLLNGHGVRKDPHEGFRFLLEAKDKKSARGLCRLGVCYENGIGVQANLEEAIHCYELAADKGDATAQLVLASCYQSGKGMSKNDKLAHYWCQMAAYQDHVKAQSKLGCLYYEGIGVLKSYTDAVYWFDIAAKGGDTVAQRYLGVCYSHGQGVDRNQSSAITWFKLAASQGDELALLFLGYSYQDIKDEQRAFEYFHRAATRGNLKGQVNVGRCYYHGRGIEQDYITAVNWFKIGAQKGHVSAQVTLGCCYRDGQGIAQDFEQALHWLTSAAKKGDSSAQNHIGNLYFQGLGVPQDFKEAVRWYELSAKQGDPDALNNLALCYDSGKGVPRNKTVIIEGKEVRQNDLAALKFFTESADKGHKHGQYHLARVYHYGLYGQKEDREKALTLYQAAAPSVDAARKGIRDLLGRR